MCVCVERRSGRRAGERKKEALSPLRRLGSTSRARRAASPIPGSDRKSLSLSLAISGKSTSTPLVPVLFKQARGPSSARLADTPTKTPGVLFSPFNPPPPRTSHRRCSPAKLRGTLARRPACRVAAASPPAAPPCAAWHRPSASVSLFAKAGGGTGGGERGERERGNWGARESSARSPTTITPPQRHLLDGAAWCCMKTRSARAQGPRSSSSAPGISPAAPQRLARALHRRPSLSLSPPPDALNRPPLKLPPPKNPQTAARRTRTRRR